MALTITCQISGLDRTADDWELYATEDGADACATRLNEKFMALVNEGLTRDQVHDAMEDFMDEEEQAKYGASDSEPQWQLRELLKEVFKV